MSWFKIKRKGFDSFSFLIIFLAMCLVFYFVANAKIANENFEKSEKVEVYCENFFEENKEIGFFKEKDLQDLKVYIKKEYGFNSNVIGNVVEDKENMFLSVELYEKNTDGNVVYKSYFIDKNSISLAK